MPVANPEGGVGISGLCTRCGRPSAEGDRFCGGCGAELGAVCATCGRPLVPDAAFCTGCGTARTDFTVEPKLTLHRAASQVNPSTTEDRRRISVLFVDLVDFTPYVEREDPELVRELQKG